ncbi:MAG: histidinol phosphate phosphatase domain-containing protein [Anaerolineae bacterium]|nr:histidinol phosphate phosphatase domain-containing protein [Anaerolineae bacterium]
MDRDLRIDLHTHSFFSDGALLPSEQLRRAAVKGYGALAITDHADASNLEDLLAALLRFARQQEGDFGLTFIPGVELTHVAPRSIAPLARRALELGAGLVVVHGETLVEPVAPGTNAAAVACPDVDILAHPGMITLEEARTAAANGVYLEVTSRQGHSLANGHVVQVARAAGASMVLNTDTHAPGDMIDQATARRVAAGAGMDADEIEAATVTNPQALVARARARMEGR